MHRTQLYDAHVAAGARMVDFVGWNMPINYGSQMDEHKAVRSDAGMFDVSHMTVVDLRGPRVRDFLRHLLANDVAKLKTAGKALYSCMLREDGGVGVLNRGYRTEKGEWDEAEGKAYFVGDPSVGRLKVSFFGPFYGAYNVFELGENYEYSMVAGPNRSYLWILARQPQLPQAMFDELLSKAEAAGYDTSKLILVEHDRAMLRGTDGSQ